MCKNRDRSQKAEQVYQLTEAISPTGGGTGKKMTYKAETNDQPLRKHGK